MRINNCSIFTKLNKYVQAYEKNLNLRLQKLSSGYRINNASDDAAGLAISEKFKTQSNGLQQANINVQNGISLLQTMEGGFQTITDILQRMRSLSVQASNETLTNNDRNLIQLEMNQLLSEIDVLQTSVQFNTKQLFNPQNISYGDYDAEKAGTNAKLLQSTGNYLSNPLYTPDGRLIYSQFTGSGGGGDYEIWIETEKNSGNFINITNDATKDQIGCFLSLNGQIIYFNQAPWMGGSNADVGKINIDGLNKTTYSWNTGQHEIVIGMTPDGNKLIIGQGPTSTENWYYANADGTGGLTLITHRTGSVSNCAAFSRDGVTLFYSANIGGVNQLFSMPADDSGPSTQLTFGSENYSSGIGGVSTYNTIDKLLVVRETAPGSGQYSLYTMNYDGSDLQKLDIFPGSSINTPKISPDDSYIVFTSNKETTWDVWRVHSGVSTIDNTETTDENTNIVIQHGANKNETIEIELHTINTTSLSLNNLSVRTVSESENALQSLDTAIQKISEYRAAAGAKYNIMEKIYNFNSSLYENQLTAESRIKDTDFAEEMIKDRKVQIMEQISVNFLSIYSNMERDAILKLFI